MGCQTDVKECFRDPCPQRASFFTDNHGFLINSSRFLSARLRLGRFHRMPRVFSCFTITTRLYVERGNRVRIRAQTIVEGTFDLLVVSAAQTRACLPRSDELSVGDECGRLLNIDADLGDTRMTCLSLSLSPRGFVRYNSHSLIRAVRCCWRSVAATGREENKRKTDVRSPRKPGRNGRSTRWTALVVARVRTLRSSR